LFPSFYIIRNVLELEEIKLDHSTAQGQVSAFYSVPSGGGRPLHQQLPPRPPQQEPSCPLTAPPPPAPPPNNGGKGKGKCKGKGKGKNNGSGNNSGNNNRGTLAWPSFYNPWTSTIMMWLGMHPPQQQPVRPLHHALLAAPVYYGAPGGPSFAPLPAHPPHQ
jgi:hypothetical protein